jgi:hypothetical protein
LDGVLQMLGNHLHRTNLPDLVAGLRETAADADVPPSRRLKAIELLVEVARRPVAGRSDIQAVRDARRALARMAAFLRQTARGHASARIRSRADRLVREVMELIETS